MTKIRSRDSSRIQDRRGQGGGGGFSFPGLGGGGMGIPTKMGGGILGIIVVLAAIFLPKLLGGSDQSAVSPTGETSGNACETELEQIVCGANEDVQNYWAATFPEAFGAEYDDTDLVLFADATGTNCGQASAAVGPFYCPADRLVYFDLDFLVQLQNQFGATGDLAAQYIVAHEFGHHVQNLIGVSDRVREAEAADPRNANRYSIALELQADCLAGVWAHDADAEGQLEAGEIDEALNAAAAVGDDRIQQQTQGRVNPESWTHGSSEQRVGWFRRGYETGDPQSCDTFQEL